MRKRVLLTHSHELTEESLAEYAYQGLDIYSFPLLNHVYRKIDPDNSNLFDNVIVSSFSVINWPDFELLNGKRYWCIGKNTESYLKKKYPFLKISRPETNFNLKSVISLIKETEGSSIWLGSHAGLLKHFNLLEKNKIKYQITHYNWPKFFNQTYVPDFFNEYDYIVSASISSTLSLSLLSWTISRPTLILTGSNLEKFLINKNIPYKVSKNHWSEEIVYN